MALTLQKRPPEVRTYEFDFSTYPEIEAGDTIVTIVSVTGTVVQGTGTKPTMTGEVISLDRKMVKVVLDGGSADITVRYQCLVTTLGGAELELLGYLKILSL